MRKTQCPCREFQVMSAGSSPQGKGAHLRWRVRHMHKHQGESTSQWARDPVNMTSLINKVRNWTHKSRCRFIPLTPSQQGGILLLWLCSSTHNHSLIMRNPPSKHIQTVKPRLKTMVIIKNKEGRRKNVWRDQCGDIQRQVNLYEFKASLVYIVSYTTAMTM